jgi:hypothetical protein
LSSAVAKTQVYQAQDQEYGSNNADADTDANLRAG